LALLLCYLLKPLLVLFLLLLLLLLLLWPVPPVYFWSCPFLT
jgi:hypothetical protein